MTELSSNGIAPPQAETNLWAVAQTAQCTAREMSELSSGIAKDIGSLSAQALELLKIEINEQLGKILRLGLATMSIVGAGVAGFMLLANALAYLISDGLGVSLAASFGVEGAVVLGGCCLGALVLRHKARALRFMPAGTIEQIKENLSWVTRTRRNP